jgi:DNA invertase Pin-like site-specific DNA recombinase
MNNKSNATALLDTYEQADAGGAAAVYVRVSDAKQVGRAGSDDGYSLPAQQLAVKKKADELGLRIAKVYIERGESARTTGARPALLQMMRELPALGVTHLIVHKIDRLARNRTDDGLLYRDLVAMGITLVSATENIDGTPAGRMLHGILATLAEFYSNNLALEIRKGMHEKHRQGGTPFRAPVGYRHERKLISGQDMRWVEVDEERARLIRLAFDMYATGEWSLIALTEHLKAQGLTSRPTPKRAAQPMGVSAIHNVLRNRYYLGEVTYEGKTVQGTHEPLVSVETFDKVQKLLVASRNGRERPSRHEQYLAGSLHCAACGRRLVYTRIKNRHGTVYDYFCCLGRRTRGRGGSCTTGHYKLAAIEEGVDAVYATLRLEPSLQDAIRDELAQHLDHEAGALSEDIDEHRRRIDALKKKQAKLLELAYADLVDEEVLRDEQERLRVERGAAEALIRQAETERADLMIVLDSALALRTDPQDAYAASTPFERRLMNRALFRRIAIGPEPGELSVQAQPVHEALEAYSKAWTADPGPAFSSSAGLTLGQVRPPCTRRPRPRRGLRRSRRRLHGRPGGREQDEHGSPRLNRPDHVDPRRRARCRRCRGGRAGRG